MFAGVGKFLSNVKNYYNEINSATLTGAIDILVVEQPDGTLQSSPFHVRFGKLGVIRSREKVVYIEINGESVEDLHMKLGPAGEAFFVHQVEDNEHWEGKEYLATSPIPALPEQPALTHSKSVENIAERKRRRRQQSESVHTSSSSSSSDLREKLQPHISTFQPIQLADEDLMVSGGMFEIEVDEDSKAPVPEMGLSKSISLPLMEENIQQRTENWAYDPYNTSAQYHHVFSDTDITPVVRFSMSADDLNSPVTSRPHTPKSDTEFEIDRKNRGNRVESEGLEEWNWGELPVPQSRVDVKLELNPDSGQPTTLTTESKAQFWSFMKSTKKMRHKPEQGGIYLDELTEADLDPKTRALYFPKKSQNLEAVDTVDAGTDPVDISKTEESESPAAEDDVESGRGASPRPVPPPATRESNTSPTSETGTMREHECGIYGNIAMSLCGGLVRHELEHVSPELFEQCLVTYDMLSQDPSLISHSDLVIRYSNKYYNWQCAAPMLMSMFCFHQTLPSTTQESLVQQYMKHETKQETQQPIATKSSWWPFGRYKKPEGSDHSPNTTPQGSPQKSVKSDEVDSSTKQSGVNGSIDTPNSEEKRSSENSRPRQRNFSEMSSYPPDKFHKTLRLSSEELVKLNLHEGENEIEFSVTTSLQGTTRCAAHIYLWKHTDKIVVSDIDGTITKSDVLGVLLPMVGKDWSQIGVTDLYTKIAANGYRFMYLTARAIGQATITRDYLQSVKQGENSLPKGPMFMNPCSLLNAFHREVIEKKPEEFKISCLRDIQSLYPQPKVLYAGFGNRINDSWAYRAVGIAKNRMFLINPSGQLKSDYSQTFQSTYSCLSDQVDHYFPPLELEATSHHSPAEYSNFTFWREPLPEVDLESIIE